MSGQTLGWIIGLPIGIILAAILLAVRLQLNTKFWGWFDRGSNPQRQARRDMQRWQREREQARQRRGQ